MSDKLLAARVTLRPAAEADFEALLALRITAMRESLERLGRFDPERARVRLRSSFHPEHTQWILLDGREVGFFTFRPINEGYRLDHLYVHPSAQSLGIGGHILKLLLARAGAEQRRVAVGALRGSASNRFYQRHGFVLVREEEWDLEYVWNVE